MKAFFKKIIVTALRWEAKLVLKKYRPKIIAVTGSVGKTSTKDAIFAVVARFANARKSQKSFNSEVGVPLTILDCQNAWGNPLLWVRNLLEGLVLIILPNYYPKWLVLEVGADHPGDIKNLTGWIKPDIVVGTRMSEVPVHVENFPDVQSLITEKNLLFKALKKDGRMVLNRDDATILGFYDNKYKLTTYGTHNTSNVRGTNYTVSYYEKDSVKIPTGFSFKAELDSRVVPINIRGSLGEHHVYPLLAALAVGNALNFNLIHQAEVLGDHEGPLGRMKLIEGLKQSTIIDDSYNASPVATAEALQTLKRLEVTGRKIAALADMKELGEYSVSEHHKIGQLVAEVCDELLVVGELAELAADSALDAGLKEEHIRRFPDSRKAGKYLQNEIRPGDVILVKGSQSMRMERVVEEIMARPELKEKLLVRQEWEWVVR